jgi:CHAT domain-containing protein/tetratricopeptide (TPR) repeat protein
VVTVAPDAEEALRLAQARPVDAKALAGTAAARAAGAGDLPSASVAERALGLVALHTADLVHGVDHLSRAVRLAERAGCPQLAAQARTTLAFALAATGNTRRALREADLAAPHLDGLDAARLQTQRAVIVGQMGMLDESLALFRTALPVLRRHGDRLWEARLLGNRGLAYTLCGKYPLAEADLLGAVRLADELGQGIIGALSRGNLGFVAARRGNVVGALGWYDESEAQLRGLGAAVAHVLRDRAEVLLSVRLVPEARQAARTALAEWRRQGESLCAAETQLLLAEAALLDGDAAEAHALAEEARQVFTRQRRSAWQAHARHVVLRAALADPGRSVSAAQARGVSAELERTGWLAAAAETRLVTAQIHLRAGDVADARAELEKASRSRRKGTIDVRARAWHAEALLRLASGRRQAAASAVSQGLRLVEDHRAALGATDLRASAAGNRAELAELGLRIAVGDGHPRRVLCWAERGRASHLTLPAVHPPPDEVLARDLTELRSTAVAVQEAIRNGDPAGPQIAGQAALERRIRARSHLVPGTRDTSRVVAVAELADSLGDQALVEYVVVDGAVLAVTLVRGRASLHELATVLEVESEVAHLLRALRWSAMVDPSQRTSTACAAAERSARFSALRLETLLVQPLLQTVRDHPLVVVPAGVLQRLPWGVLPGLRARPIAVAPSASAWRAAAGRPARSRTTVLAVAGPDLAGAAAEAAAVARLYPRAELLTGVNATAAAVTKGIAEADVVHVAAHSNPRADNPLFSHVRVADGPLTVCDLERTERVSSIVVLSACDAGRAQESSGNELFGLATAFLALHCRALIAPMLCVRDAETVDPMLSLHARLSAGTPPAEALADARLAGASALEDPLSSVDVFCCFGAG